MEVLMDLVFDDLWKQCELTKRVAYKPPQLKDTIMKNFRLIKFVY